MIYTILILVSLCILIAVFIRKMPDIVKIEFPKWGNTNLIKKNTAPSKSFNFFEKFEKKETKKENIVKPSKSFNFFTSNANENVLFDEADMFFKHNNIAEAEKLYLKIASINPKNIKVYNRLGVIYMQKKEFSDAKEAFLMAVRLDPKKASRHYNLATSYDELREYRNAQESLEKALKIDSDNKKYQKYFEELKEKVDYRYKEMKRKED